MADEYLNRESDQEQAENQERQTPPAAASGGGGTSSPSGDGQPAGAGEGEQASQDAGAAQGGAWGPSYYSGQQNYQYPPYPGGVWRSDGGRPSQQPYQWNFDQMHGASAQAPRKKRRGLKVFLALVCAVALVFVAVFAGYGIYVAATGDTLQPPAEAPESLPEASYSVPEISMSDKPIVSGGTNPDGTLTNQEIFKMCSPTVVGVVGYAGSTGLLSGQVSEGSGIVMTEDGYILTNAHVVSDTMITDVEVVLTNGESHPAAIVGMDTQTDIAVLKVNLTGLAYAEFGNSDQLEVGERVIAIGNPGGLRFASSLTVGYVSALNRTIIAGDAGYSMETIQTDAAINPGNSGGPLINAFGQVVGINSAKYNDPDFEGMGFAIPINTAMPVAQDLIANGRVTGRAMLGITAKIVTASYAEQYGIPLGLEIQEVQPDSDIAAKGVRAGDILTHINGTPIYSFDASAAALSAYQPGDTVEITIFRRDSWGKDSTFNLEIILTGG